jgi:hypothetical protein
MCSMAPKLFRGKGLKFVLQNFVSVGQTTFRSIIMAFWFIVTCLMTLIQLYKLYNVESVTCSETLSKHFCGEAEKMTVACVSIHDTREDTDTGPSWKQTITLIAGIKQVCLTALICETEFGNVDYQKERGNWEDQDVFRWTILTWISERWGWDGMIWIGLIWLRIGTSGGLLWKR